MRTGAFHPLLLGAALAASPYAFAVYDPPPPTEIVELDSKDVQPFCVTTAPSSWRDAQAIEGVDIQESRVCNPDNPYTVAAAVKGTNNISMNTLMETNLATDAIVKTNDYDGDGDPDHIIIRLEVMELNGRSPDDASLLVPGFEIAPGVQPGFWVFAPKTRDMSTASFASTWANPTLRAPSPPIRVEEGDTVWLVLENTHYFPHTIHLHGVDHPFMDHGGQGNDGVGQTSAMDVAPGATRVYEIQPRVAGTQYYHCHTQPHYHIPMGLQGLFIVEENRPNNWVQTINVGAGQVRHPSVAVREEYQQEYDLHYQSVDKELHGLVQVANDPRLIGKLMNQEYDITDATDDYFLINGRAFPYSLRESLLVVEPDQKIKLRVLNGHTEAMGLHIHGHKGTVTHYDGVEHNPAARITRDVYTMTPAQRLDIEISTRNDGLHSFGEGVWMFHDHVEKSFTTDGQGEGGGLSLLVYKNYLSEDGTPKTHGMDLSPYFSKTFWKRGYPVWQQFDEWGSLGLPAGVSLAAADTGKAPAGAPTPAAPQAPAGQPVPISIALRNLLVGLLLGTAGYFAFLNKKRLGEMVDAIRGLFKGATGGK